MRLTTQDKRDLRTLAQREYLSAVARTNDGDATGELDRKKWSRIIKLINTDIAYHEAAERDAEFRRARKKLAAKHKRPLL